MTIASATFIKGIVDEDEILEDGKPQIAFIGRSNVGKSSVINSIMNKKDLARTSSFPGRTQQINLYLISARGGSASGGNDSFYLADLPGYGFAKASKESQEGLQRLIHWYLFASPYQQKKIVLIIDGSIGATNNDMEMLYSLKEHGKNIIIVANKVDKIKKSAYKKQLQSIQEVVGDYKLIPYSAEKKIGLGELVKEILGD